MFKELSNFEVKNLNENIKIISTANDSMYMYLICGEKKDVLIDTGYGYGDLKSFVCSLTSKPIAVFNTHGHPDHTGANDSFSEIYQSAKAKADFHEAFGKKINLEKEINIVKDKDVISISDNTFEIYECASHSNSDIIVVDTKNRVAFVGDIVDPHQVLFVAFSDEITNYKERVKLHIKAMQLLKSLANKFDVICPAHNGTPIEKSLIDELIELDLKILDDTAEIFNLDHKYIKHSPDAPYMRRVRYKNCSVIYRLPRLSENKIDIEK